jgi:D-lactate dehydrogenase
MLPNYKKLLSDLLKFIPAERILTDELRTFAYGTDASFYKLIPKLVVKVTSEDEVIHTIKKCSFHNIPITFRASGTSLSGQSISDSVLIVADRSWNQINISEDQSKVTVQPAALGGAVNLKLSKFNKKIGPDPASINAATIAGIAANNASGMTSGVKYNSYNTVADMRIVFANGAVLNTSDKQDREKFIEENRELVVELLTIASEIENNPIFLRKIVSKYKIKNTTGYGINSLVDYQNPIEIIKHLMIGSEGTLGFISQITLNTVKSFPDRASSLILFPDVKTACSTIPILQKLPVDAAEIMDRASIRSVEDKKGMPDYLKDLSSEAAALLIETSAVNKEFLQKNISDIKENLSSVETIRPVEFTDNPTEYLRLWNVRKGLFPSVSKARPSGTTVVIEDVNFDTEKLADAVTDLQKLFFDHDYENTIIWGHALSGNIHFVFAQDFSKPHEIERYKKFMNEVVLLVIEKYDGSLKAEHGTGRNMAPFVMYEWGREIYGMMQRIKKAFDPNDILNPGVLINDDEEIYIKNLKPTPVVDPIIDKCIDCGFCENSCPSKNLTLTPRQRISVWREINSLRNSSRDKKREKKIAKLYNYFGEQTCATDGLCELSCPVDIDTGKLVKSIRSSNHSKISILFAKIIANQFAFITTSLKFGLNILAVKKKIFGVKIFSLVFNTLRKISFGKIPLWNTFLPQGSKAKYKNDKIENDDKVVIYFPSCVSRTMGKYTQSKHSEDQSIVMQRLFTKAGYKVIYPKKLNNLCCGMPFSSKGFNEQADAKSEELYQAFNEINQSGEIPIVFDTSPCVKTFNKFLMNNKNAEFRVYDSVEFIADKILDKLNITPKEDKVAIHSTCSTTKMDLTDNLVKIAKTCVKDIYIPEDINCCGFAGDRGFTHPELNESALENLRNLVKKNDCTEGYSNSRTCEIGLSLHSGIEYNSIAYLVDECSESKD